MKIRNLTDIKTLFFDNKTIKQTVFKNTFWLALSSGISRFFTFFLFIYVARILGPTEYGKFTFALAFILLFGIFVDLGLSRVSVRELSREKEREKEYPALLSLKFILISGTLITVLIGSFFITSDPTIQRIIWILAFYVMIGSFVQTIYSYLEARQQMEYEALAKILGALLYAGFGFFVILNFPSVENLAYGSLASVLVFLILFLVFFHFKIYRLRFSWNTLIWRKYLKMSWPLVFTAFFATVYSQIGSVIMGSLDQITQTGWYNAAYKTVLIMVIPVSIIATSFFPVLSKTFKETEEKFQKIWNYQMEIMIFFSIPLMAGGMVLAPKIIDYIFGSTFGPSILAFRILILMVGIISLYTFFHWALIIADQQKKTLFVGLIGIAINIILNLVLIPRYSLYGAAVTTVITYFLMSFLFYVLISKFTTIKALNLGLLPTSIGVIISSSIMYLVISHPIIYHFHVIYSIAIGVLVYLICFYGYKKGINKLLS